MAATLIATMRDEAPFILEWVAYHLEIGFDQIIVFSNDCTDGTDEILAALDAAGVITHVDHDVDPNRSVAEQVARKIQDQNMISFGDWVIWLDGDEFLNIHTGRGHIDDLVAAVGDVRGMCISWRIFGDSNQGIFRGAFLDEDFVECALAGQVWQNVKTLFQHGPDVVELFQHKPIMARDFWKNGGYFLSSSGRKLRGDDEDVFMKSWVEGKKRGKIAEDAAGWEVAQINHYAVRTKPLFERKQRRGRIGEANTTSKSRYNSRYFRDLNLNGTTDRSILRWADRTRLRVDELNATLTNHLDVAALIAQHYPSEVVAISDLAATRKPSKSPERALPSDVLTYRNMHKSHHDEIDERKYSNSRLAQLVYDTFGPRKIVDVGCGIGLLLSFLKDLGSEVTGIEGLWLDENSTILPSEHYRRMDLEQHLSVEQTFDVACCIEVAEHLEPSRAASFVADLCALSNVVVFSAAISGQGGKGHKNEQWQEYWCRLFEGQGFSTYDPFRQTLRRDPKVLPWFQQNVLVFIRDGDAWGEALIKDRIEPETANMILPTYHRKVVKRTQKRYRAIVEEAHAASAVAQDQLIQARKATVAGNWPPAHTNVLIATCMKDEGPFILEWLAWHKAIGIEKFVVYTNHCTDGTDLILDRLQEMGEVRHLPNPAVATGDTFYQPAALSAVQDLPEFEAADFFVSMDVDEFINIRTGSGHISDLLEAVGPFDALSMTELNHGSNGRSSFEPGLLTEQFPKHQTMAPGKWKSGRGVKTIVRLGDKLEKIRNHRPDFKSGELPVWLDGSGRSLETLAKDPSLNGIDCRGTYNLVVLDHFSLRSLESFLIKMSRGDVVINGKRVSQRYWRVRNNDVEVKSGLDHSRPAFREYLDKLMSDTKLKALHEASCQNHASRITDLLEQDDYKARKAWILENSWYPQDA